MKKLVIASILLTVGSIANANLSEGQAAIIGGLIGYGFRGNQIQQTYPVYPNGYPPAPPPQVIVVPNYGGQVYTRPHVNDYCSTMTYIDGVYDPGRAQWVCRYGGTGR